MDRSPGLPSLPTLKARVRLDTSSEAVERQQPASTSRSISAPVPRFATKRTPAQRAGTLLNQLLDVLETEWKALRSLNLGVKSGTGVVDEVLMRKITQWIQQLQTLCISNDDAAGAFAAQCNKLDHSQLQQLQVMFDLTNHQTLTDFMRISVYNTSDPFATEAVGNIDWAALKGRAARKGRRRTTAASSSAPRVSTRAARPQREEFIRFAGYLPEGHPLAQCAYRTYNERSAAAAAGDAEGASEEGSKDGSAKGRRDGGKAAYQPGFLRAASIKPQRQPAEWELNSEGELPAEGEGEARRWPMWGDVEERWRLTMSADPRDDLLDSITLFEPQKPYAVVPDFKLKALEREKEAASKLHNTAGGNGLSNSPSFMGHRGVSRSPSRMTLLQRTNAATPRASGDPGTRPSSHRSVAGAAAPPTPKLGGGATAPAPAPQVKLSASGAAQATAAAAAASVPSSPSLPTPAPVPAAPPTPSRAGAGAVQSRTRVPSASPSGPADPGSTFLTQQQG